MGDHKAEETKGRVKKAAGNLTGDKDLQREGELDQPSAATKKTVDAVADKLKEIVIPKR
jgi:uncharacterized protein YjbJ (UPF0337 family)